MEDGVPFYIAKAIKALYNCSDLWRIKWPTNLPDLNLIKNIWQLLKY